MLRLYANKTVLEGFIKVEDDLNMTKEESDGLMTKMIAMQKSKCYIFILTIIMVLISRCLLEMRYSHEKRNSSLLSVKYSVSIKN